MSKRAQVLYSVSSQSSPYRWVFVHPRSPYRRVFVHPRFFSLTEMKEDSLPLTNVAHAYIHATPTPTPSLTPTGISGEPCHPPEQGARHPFDQSFISHFSKV